MDLLFCLRDILSEFRHLFNQQSFALFQAFIFGLIANKGTSGTLTELYQCSGSQTRYWSFRSSSPGGNGTRMLSPQFSSNAFKAFFRIGFTSMMRPRH